MQKRNVNYDWQTGYRRSNNIYPVPDHAARLQRQFGTTLRAERLARKLTQEQLAFQSHLSLTYIGEIERGQRMISLDTLQRLATALNLTGAELLARAKL